MLEPRPTENVSFKLPDGGEVVGVRVEHPETAFWYIGAGGSIQLALDLSWDDEQFCRCATVIIDNVHHYLYENGRIFVENDEKNDHGIKVVFS